MTTIFLARYLPGIGVARLFLGQPARISDGPLQASGQLLMEFCAGQCLGILWYWHERRGQAMRVAAIGRCVPSRQCALQLPGLYPALDIRVLVEQAGALGRNGPVDHYLRRAESAGEGDPSYLPFAVTSYLHLRPRIDIRPRTLARMHEVFDSPAERLSQRVLQVPAIGQAAALPVTSTPPRRHHAVR